MPEILSSWKEIATYLGKGVRTVQRWERELGLPIHRPDARQQRIVIAFEEELAQWVQGHSGNGQGVPATALDTPERAQQVTSALAERVRRLSAVTLDLQQRLATSLEKMRKMREQSAQGAHDSHERAIVMRGKIAQLSSRVGKLGPPKASSAKRSA